MIHLIRHRKNALFNTESISVGVLYFSFLAIHVFLTGHPVVLAADSLSRTESNCTIGMAKGDPKAECRVPIPAGCTVAQFPGYPEPWADISKGGGTTCEFNPNQTDWKTSIVGTCQSCQTEQCTGRFIVMFNCADTIPPANQAPPKQR